MAVVCLIDIVWSLFASSVQRRFLHTVKQLFFAAFYFSVLTVFMDIFAAIIFADCSAAVCKNNIQGHLRGDLFSRILFLAKINGSRK